MSHSRASCLVSLSLAIAACADPPELSSTTQAAYDDATTGGTIGFYFLPPLVSPPTFSGTFDGSLASLVDIELRTVDCAGAGTTGDVVKLWATVMVGGGATNPRYFVQFTVGSQINVMLNNCYRVIPLLDGEPLGFRDVAVLAGGTPPVGYKKWTFGANQSIDFRLEDMDPDDDGVFNTIDNCPFVANPGQEDTDGNGQGDACEGTDTDGDGVPDAVDVCPSVPDPQQVDNDGDGVGFACESCDQDPDKTEPGVCGCGVSDVDQDGDGLICDDPCPLDPTNDADGDGLCGAVDPCPFDADNDLDDDGVCGDVDNCIDEPNPDQADGDGDGQGDACEPLCLAGVIGQWTGDDTAADSRGTAHGTWFGIPAYADAVVGRGFSFDTTNRVRAPFTHTGAWSVSLWARANTVQDKNHGLVASATSAQADSFQIDWGPLGIYRIRIGADALVISLGYTSVGVFYHLVVTYDGAEVRTYRDGILIGTGAWSGPPLRFATLQIGANRGSTLRYNGRIDDVAVFDRALTEVEAAALHDVGRFGLCP